MMILFFGLFCFLVYFVFINSSHVLILLIMVEFFVIFCFVYLIFLNFFNVYSLFFLLIAVCIGAYSVCLFVNFFRSSCNSYCLSTSFFI